VDLGVGVEQVFDDDLVFPVIAEVVGIEARAVAIDPQSRRSEAIPS